MFCMNCGKAIADNIAFCGYCGAAQRVAVKPGQSVKKPYSAVLDSRVAGGTGNTGHVNLSQNPRAANFADRFQDGMPTVSVCVAGIIVALLGLITFSGTWLSLKPLFGFGSNTGLTLLQASDLASSIGSVAQYFDSSATSIFQLIALVAMISHWILLLGSIVMLAVSIIILVYPKAEVVIFIPYVIFTAFAVIGLLFVIAPIYASDYLGFTFIPVLMLVVAGIPAVVCRFLG